MFFCDELATTEDTLHSVSRWAVDSRVRRCASIINDETLLAKVSSADMIAMEGKYHARCLVSLYNKVRSLQATSTNEYFCNEGIAIAQVVDYIQAEQEKSDKPVHFLLRKLSKLSQQKLKDLGMSQQRINSHQY